MIIWMKKTSMLSLLGIILMNSIRCIRCTAFRPCTVSPIKDFQCVEPVAAGISVYWSYSSEGLNAAIISDLAGWVALGFGVDGSDKVDDSLQFHGEVMVGSPGGGAAEYAIRSPDLVDIVAIPSRSISSKISNQSVSVVAGGGVKTTMLRFTRAYDDNLNTSLSGIYISRVGETKLIWAHATNGEGSLTYHGPSARGSIFIFLSGSSALIRTSDESAATPDWPSQSCGIKSSLGYQCRALLSTRLALHWTSFKIGLDNSQLPDGNEPNSTAVAPYLRRQSRAVILAALVGVNRDWLAIGPSQNGTMAGARVVLGSRSQGVREVDLTDQTLAGFRSVRLDNSSNYALELKRAEEIGIFFHRPSGTVEIAIEATASNGVPARTLGAAVVPNPSLGFVGEDNGASRQEIVLKFGWLLPESFTSNATLMLPNGEASQLVWACGQEGGSGVALGAGSASTSFMAMQYHGGADRGSSLISLLASGSAEGSNSTTYFRDADSAAAQLPGPVVAVLNTTLALILRSRDEALAFAADFEAQKVNASSQGDKEEDPLGASTEIEIADPPSNSTHAENTTNSSIDAAFNGDDDSARINSAASFSLSSAPSTNLASLLPPPSWQPPQPPAMIATGTALALIQDPNYYSFVPEYSIPNYVSFAPDFSTTSGPVSTGAASSQSASPDPFDERAATRLPSAEQGPPSNPAGRAGGAGESTPPAAPGAGSAETPDDSAYALIHALAESLENRLDREPALGVLRGAHGWLAAGASALALPLALLLDVGFGLRRRLPLRRSEPPGCGHGDAGSGCGGGDCGRSNTSGCGALCRGWAERRTAGVMGQVLLLRGGLYWLGASLLLAASLLVLQPVYDPLPAFDTIGGAGVDASASHDAAAVAPTQLYMRESPGPRSSSRSVPVIGHWSTHSITGVAAVVWACLLLPAASFVLARAERRAAAASITIFADSVASGADTSQAALPATLASAACSAGLGGRDAAIGSETTGGSRHAPAPERLLRPQLLVHQAGMGGGRHRPTQVTPSLTPLSPAQSVRDNAASAAIALEVATSRLRGAIGAPQQARASAPPRGAPSQSLSGTRALPPLNSRRRHPAAGDADAAALRMPAPASARPTSTAVAERLRIAAALAVPGNVADSGASFADLARQQGQGAEGVDTSAFVSITFEPWRSNSESGGDSESSREAPSGKGFRIARLYRRWFSLAGLRLSECLAYVAVSAVALHGSLLGRDSRIARARDAHKQFELLYNVMTTSSTGSSPGLGEPNLKAGAIGTDMMQLLPVELEDAMMRSVGEAPAAEGQRGEISSWGEEYLVFAAAFGLVMCLIVSSVVFAYECRTKKAARCEHIREYSY